MIRIRKIAAAVLAAAMCFGLFTGCSKKASEVPLAPKDYIYKLTEFKPTGETYDYLSSVAAHGGSVYLLTSVGETAGDKQATSQYLYKTDSSGAVLEKQLLSSETARQIEDNGYATIYSSVAVGKDGSVYLVKLKSGRFPDAEGVITEGIKTEIVKKSGDTETVLVDVNKELDALDADTASMYVSHFTIDDNNIAYISANMREVWAFDLATGDVVFENKPIPDIAANGGTVKGLFETPDGNINIVSYGAIEENGETVDKLIITPINTATGSYGTSESIDAPGGIQSNIAQGDAKYDYYGFGVSSIHGYKDGIRSLVADLPASGVNLNQISRVLPVSETEFILTGTTPESIVLDKLFKLTKVDPKDVPDKTIITVASIEDEYYFSGYLAEFTAAHPEYQVEYKLYAEDSGTSFEDALKAFNTDVLAGKIPDVLVINSLMPYGNYADKGLFANLYPLIDKDPDVSRGDYYKPFLEALETDGKLFSIAPIFQVYTLAGKTSVFGEKQGQSLEELEEAAAKVPGASLFGNINRADFIDGFFMRMSYGFIDTEKGVCNYEDPEFISLLEYAKTFPAPAPDAPPFMSSTWFPGETSDYKEDKILLEYMNLFDLREIVSLEQVEFGEPITFLGFPNGYGGSGITARARLETAVMADAKNPDGAWEFVKGLQGYGDPFTESCGYPPLMVFPLLQSEMDILAKNATEPAFQYDFTTGERIPRIQWLGADLSGQPNNTEADNEKMFKLFKSIDGIHRSIPAINDIIREETDAYFAGDRSAEETAKIIQNRATTYLEESK
jgi:hypothetical protein